MVEKQFHSAQTTLFVIFLSALTPCIVSAQQPEVSERTRARGTFQIALTRFLLDHDRTKGREGFLAALKQDPTYAPPRFNLAVLAEALVGRVAKRLRHIYTLRRLVVGQFKARLG